MTRTEKRQKLLALKVASNPNEKNGKHFLSFAKVTISDKDEILNDETIWKGYQAYNSLMREYGETDYKYLNSSEVEAIKLIPNNKFYLS